MGLTLSIFSKNTTIKYCTYTKICPPQSNTALSQQLPPPPEKQPPSNYLHKKDIHRELTNISFFDIILGKYHICYLDNLFMSAHIFRTDYAEPKIHSENTLFHIKRSMRHAMIFLS